MDAPAYYTSNSSISLIIVKIFCFVCIFNTSAIAQAVAVFFFFNIYMFVHVHSPDFDLTMSGEFCPKCFWDLKKMYIFVVSADGLIFYYCR